jgi:hypothetical protein
MLAVFSVGMPGLYLFMLHKHRPAVNASGGHEHVVLPSGLYGSMSFFYNDYSAVCNTPFSRCSNTPRNHFPVFRNSTIGK